MDRFADLQAFVAVVEIGSFSGAADRLGIAKSAISRRVTLLERRLDARLLKRTTRRLSLTDAGAGFYDCAVRLLHDLEEAEQEVAGIRHVASGRLKVAAPLSFGLRHLQPIIHEFLIEHEGIELDLDLNDRQIDLVEEGFDVAVRIGDLADSTLIARRIADTRRLTVASPEYLVRHGTPRHPDELKDHYGLRYSNISHGTAWTFIDRDGRRRRAEINERLSSNNGLILAAAAVSGLGICALPVFEINDALAAGRLLPILDDWVFPKVGIHLVYPPGRFFAKRTRIFSDLLAARLAENTNWRDYSAPSTRN